MRNNKNTGSKFLTCILFLCLHINSFALVSTFELRCASVLSNGNVNLSWVNTSDNSASFGAYYIYSSTSASGTYTLLDSIKNYATTNYTHNTTLGNTNKIFYKIGIRFNNQTTINQSDYISTILLNVVQSPGNASLTWNELHTPNLTSNSGSYKIYREQPAGSWTFITTTTALSYTDIVTACDEVINYKIEVDDNSGCTSVSNIDGDRFVDQVEPEYPLIDSVSVDLNTGQVILGWQKSTSIDTKEYRILWYDRGISNYSYSAIVSGINNTTFIDAGSITNPNTQSEWLNVIARDECNRSSSGRDNSHKTIYLKAEIDLCSGSANVQWTKYLNWKNGVGSYDLFASKNNGAWYHLGNFGAEDTSYSHTDLEKYAKYCYYVRAKESNSTRSSTSNKVCITANITAFPKYAYLSTVTVIGEGKVAIKIQADTLAKVYSFDVYRSVSNSDDSAFKKIGTIQTANKNRVTFIDSLAPTSLQSVAYRYQIIDSCGVPRNISNIAKTIFLSTDASIDLRHRLTWSAYRKWDASVDHYQIYRSIDENDSVLISSTLPENLFYDDYAYKETSGKGNFCYLVEAIESEGNSYKLMEKSQSNKVCFKQEETSFIPNAFNPSDIYNPTFKPVLTFYEPLEYYFAIFDRFGRKIFYSEDPQDAWDGNINGDVCPIGVYAYKLKYLNQQGRKIEKTGTITLLRF